MPLQTLCGAVFDAILVHMMNTVEPTGWQPLRADMCLKLNSRKNARTVEILETTYKDYDVQFLQEAAAEFVDEANAAPLGMAQFDVHFPEKLDGDRNQNSLILLKKGEFTDVKEITDSVLSSFKPAADSRGKAVPLDNGDLFAVVATGAADGTEYLFASFHGDTNGLATIPVVSAVNAYATASLPQHKLVFGLDANVYEHPTSDQQGLLAFAEYYAEAGLTSVYGDHPNPKNYTTFHARTYLQPQLNKAITFEEKDEKGDKNPKDAILFFPSTFRAVDVQKDNTGNREYVDGMVFPTMSFPSDHGITSGLLVPKAVDSVRRRR